MKEQLSEVKKRELDEAIGDKRFDLKINRFCRRTVVGVGDLALGCAGLSFVDVTVFHQALTSNENIPGLLIGLAPIATTKFSRMLRVRERTDLQELETLTARIEAQAIIGDQADPAAGVVEMPGQPTLHASDERPVAA